MTEQLSDIIGIQVGISAHTLISSIWSICDNKKKIQQYLYTNIYDI